jgi:hypothetical protein
VREEKKRIEAEAKKNQIPEKFEKRRVKRRRELRFIFEVRIKKFTRGKKRVLDHLLTVLFARIPKFQQVNLQTLLSLSKSHAL